MTKDEYLQQFSDEFLNAIIFSAYVDLSIANTSTPPQLSYPPTRQGAIQCFDDMMGQGYKLDLVRYHYYKP